MPKMFGSEFKRQYVQSEEIMRLINKANMLTDGDGYQLYDDNAESLERILDKILTIARREEEWYCYFDALESMIYLLDIQNEYKKILKYAEVFYRDNVLYMNTAVLKYPNTNVGEYGVWIYSEIFRTYRCFPQITDEKMETFMEMYRQSAQKYGGGPTYYRDKLKLALQYKDTEQAKQAKERLEQTEIKS